jgi:putative nucleotidyltransferase with HDIG domain
VPETKQTGRFLAVVREFWRAESAVARRHRRRWAWTGLAALLIAGVLSPGLLGSVPRLTVGAYHVGTYRAPFAITVVDERATAESRDKAIAETPPIFDYDPDLGRTAAERIRRAFAAARAHTAAAGEASPTPRATDGAPRRRETAENPRAGIDAARSEFVAELQTDLRAGDFEALASARFDAKLTDLAAQLLADVYSHYISYDFEARLHALDAEGRRFPARLELRTAGRTEIVTIAAEQALTPQEALERLRSLSARLLVDVPPDVREPLRRIAAAQIKPNLVFSPAASAAAGRRAAAAVVPVTYAFEKNQLVIGDGQPVTRQTILVLDAIRQRAAAAGWVSTLFGTAALIFAIIALSFRLTGVDFPHVSVSDRDVLMMGLLLLGAIFAVRLAGWFDRQLADVFPLKPEQFFLFVLPLAAPTMLVRLLTRFEISLVFSIALTILVALAADAPLPVMATIFLIMIVGAYAAGDAGSRGHLWRGGLLVGLTAAALASILGVMGDDFSFGALVVLPLAGLVGGLLSALLTIGLAPVFEWAFGYMTDISLLELANYESPLLKSLARLAPGTFHHSIALGLLAEAAAEATGANALLTRVGAMFHDIGKTMNPRYFVENRKDENPHDAIPSPSESARLIIAHVPDGVRLAREHGLPQDVIDFIEQHHGTRYVTYFLDKARTLARETGVAVDETAFRYPGPKPQNKETAIIMISDSVEARSRTIDHRDPRALQQMIHQVIANIGDEGQFDECPLTTADFHRIEIALAQVILGMHHERIAYPDQRRRGFLRKKIRG